MTVIKCDRCGRIFEEKTVGFCEDIANVVKKLTEPKETTRRNEQIEEIKDLLDLCPDCTESLKKWLETGTEKEIK